MIEASLPTPQLCSHVILTLDAALDIKCFISKREAQVTLQLIDLLIKRLGDDIFFIISKSPFDVNFARAAREAQNSSMIVDVTNYKSKTR